MSKVKFQKGSPEFNWFGEFWKIVQEFWVPEKDSDVYWKMMTDTINNFYEKYKGTDKLEHFCKKMSIAFLEFIEEESGAGVNGGERMPQTTARGTSHLP